MAGGYGLWFWTNVATSRHGNSTGVPDDDDGVIFLHFDNDVFFNFILPPIIFSAGALARISPLWRRRAPALTERRAGAGGARWSQATRCGSGSSSRTSARS